MLISVSGFRKAYDNTLAVDQINFQLNPGEILGLIGPNGAGKTTTMRSLSGLTVPSEGELLVCGYNIEKNPLEVKKRLAYIPDDPPLFPELTVDQHLAFTASVFSVKNAQQKADALLASFELSEKRGTRASELSRGMRQKLAICCSYLHDPEVILLDEPMTGLDPLGIRMLKKTLKQRASEGAAVIVSSHLLAMVEDICTHVLVLKKGQQKFVGTIPQLKSLFTVNDASATLEQIFFQATELESLEVFEHEQVIAV